MVDSSSRGDYYEPIIYDSREARVKNIVIFEDTKHRVDDRLRGVFEEARRVVKEVLSGYEGLDSAGKSRFIFNKSSGRLKVRNLAGFVITPQAVIWIVPKFVPKKLFQRGAEDSNVLSDLLLLYHHLFYFNKNLFRGVAPYGFRKDKPLDFLSQLYVILLAEALKAGVHREFVNVEEESVFIKGRVILREISYKYPAKLHKPTINYPKLSIDTSLNRVLRVALDKALITLSGETTRFIGLKLRTMLKDVNTQKCVLEREFLLTRFNKLNERFREVFNLALLILGFNGGFSRRSISLVENTHVIFQNYIGQVLKYFLSMEGEDRSSSREIKILDVKTQETHVLDVYRFITGSNGSGFNRVGEVKFRPDYIIKYDGKIVPLDVKYKCICEGEDLEININLSDVYQAVFYADALKSNKSILVYPYFTPFGEHGQRGEEWYQLSVGQVKVFIVKYDFQNVIKNYISKDALVEPNQYFLRALKKIIEE